MINSTNFLSLWIFSLILKLSLFLFHCLIDDSLLKHLTEPLVEWLQSEVVWWIHICYFVTIRCITVWSIEILNFITCWVDAVCSFCILCWVSCFALLCNLNCLSVLLELVALQTLFNTLQLSRICFCWTTCDITVFIRNIEMSILIQWFPFTLWYDYSPIEILFLWHLAVTLHAYYCLTYSATSCKFRSWITLAFPPSIVFISTKNLSVCVICRVIQVVQRAQCPVRTSSTVSIS